ncbi:hypothetical protein [Methanosarcina siciliae]|nr:hypothetical protein [Methanosarcina siciliae]
MKHSLANGLKEPKPTIQFTYRLHFILLASPIVVASYLINGMENTTRL